MWGCGAARQCGGVLNHPEQEICITLIPKMMPLPLAPLWLRCSVASAAATITTIVADEYSQTFPFSSLHLVLFVFFHCFCSCSSSTSFSSFLHPFFLSFLMLSSCFIFPLYILYLFFVRVFLESIQSSQNFTTERFISLLNMSLEPQKHKKITIEIRVISRRIF